MTDAIGRTGNSATPAGQSDTFITLQSGDFSVTWHRTVIHTVPLHGCALCPPTPCPCGYTGKLCPDYFEHHRNDAGAEIAAWRAA